MREQRQLGVVAAVPAALSVAALSAPLLAAFGYTLSALAILQFFSVACHQDPARSFWVAGAPIAVCIRCLGIYLGGIAGAWIRASRRAILKLLAGAALVSLLDYFAEAAGLHGDWPSVRWILGALLGAGGGALIVQTTLAPASGRLPDPSPAGSPRRR